MDVQAFDQLTKKLATGSSRRVLLRRFAGGFLGLATIHATAGRTHAQACAGIQESCEELDCCFGYGCNENKICIAAAECAELGGGCLVDEQCCGSNICGDDGICVRPGGGTGGGDDGGTATELPGTGVGHPSSSTSWLAGATAVAGAALMGGKRLQERPILVESASTEQ